MKKDANFVLYGAITAAVISSSIAVYLILKERGRRKFSYNNRRNINNENLKVNSLVESKSDHDIKEKNTKVIDPGMKVMEE